MDFSLTTEQRLLVQTARRFVAAELAPLEQQVEDTGALDPALAQRIFERSKATGLFAVNMPTELGGGGLSAVDTCLVEEQFGHTTDILIRRALGNVYDVLLLANAMQRYRWLVPSVRGERVFSVAFTEPEAGSDAAGIRTRAVRDGTGWVLTGQKILSATRPCPISSWSPLSPVHRPTRKASRCSWSTRACPASPWAATRR